MALPITQYAFASTINVWDEKPSFDAFVMSLDEPQLRDVGRHFLLMREFPTVLIGNDSLTAPMHFA
jgi:hypothetical protein